MEGLGAPIRGAGILLSHSVPLVPFVLRFALLVEHRKVLRRAVRGPNPELHRSWFMGMAGFSLAGLAIVASSPALADLKYAAYDLIISFCLYFSATAMQSWKTTIWQDQLADGLRDGAGGGIVVFLLRLTAWLENKYQLDQRCVVIVAFLAVTAWTLEWLPGVYYSRRWVQNLEQGQADRTRLAEAAAVQANLAATAAERSRLAAEAAEQAKRNEG